MAARGNLTLKSGTRNNNSNNERMRVLLLYLSSSCDCRVTGRASSVTNWVGRLKFYSESKLKPNSCLSDLVGPLPLFRSRETHTWLANLHIIQLCADTTTAEDKSCHWPDCNSILDQLQTRVYDNPNNKVQEAEDKLRYINIATKHGIAHC